MKTKQIPKRMTREIAMAFIQNIKCSFKSCTEIADYTMQFDDISLLPIETNAAIRVCQNHKGVIIEDYPDTKFKKILFVDGVHRIIICQRCGYQWTPNGLAPSSAQYGVLPKGCVKCHSRAWQVKPPE